MATVLARIALAVEVEDPDDPAEIEAAVNEYIASVPEITVDEWERID